MAGMNPAARARVAGLMGGGMEMGGNPEAMPPLEAPPEMPGGEGMEADLMSIEAKLDAAPPAIAEKARAHLNALREIAAEIEGAAPEGELPPVPESPEEPAGGSAGLGGGGELMA